MKNSRPSPPILDSGTKYINRWPIVIFFAFSLHLYSLSTLSIQQELVERFKYPQT